MASISIIIPFYKDYAYIKQAVDSVLAEDLRDFEIIIVNDNPCERSQSFLSGCRFPNPVRIVTHEANRGLSAARNTGVANANGEYIAYLDADDFLLPGGLAHHVSWAHKSGADVCHSVTVIHEQRGSKLATHKILGRDRKFFQVTDPKTNLAAMPELQFIVSSWQSIYRRGFLESSEIRFDEAQQKFEDRLYVLETVFSDAQFALTDMPTRVWRRRSGSITTSDKSPRDIEMMTALIDKCTGLAEACVREGRISPIHLEREVVHSLSRLLWELPVLEAALEEDDLALRIRPVLSKALARSEPNPQILLDPIAREIVNFGLPNKRGELFSPDLATAVWRGIVSQDWDNVRSLQEMARQANAARLPKPEPAGPTPVKTAQSYPDRELIVHVGLHKTGTTHLQRQFVRNDEALRRIGVLFPKTGFVDHRGVSLKPEGTPGHQAIARAITNNDRTVFDELEKEIVDSGCKKIVLSCENLCFPFTTDEVRREYVDRADEFLRAFPNRRVIATIRRSDQYIESIYRERITSVVSTESRNIFEFLVENRNRLLNIREMLEPWSVFSGGNLSLLDYEKLRREDNYFAAFCENIGIDPIAVPSKRAAAKHTYKTPPWDVVELIRILKTCIHDPDRLEATSRSLIHAASFYPSDNRGKYLLSVDDRLDVISDSRNYNQAFFDSLSFHFDYDAIEQELESDRQNWSPPDGIDYRLVETFVSMIQSSDAAASVGPAAAADGPDAAVQALLRSPGASRILVAMMRVYRRTPNSVRRLAKLALTKLYGTGVRSA
ncbi:glycosyltransferase family 2 protein [Microbaculum marinisediminis]|uniref:Glycosyltransferase n=1 Tax=Microbaculum marinisediminis TaxID=2931392 RepID=A0AAW5R6T6_9HYPH|nr:glycosyltransferase family 2 protein [Microbaculum sp. A6E488]MCT8974618.1 glycosyltransferase [Microbaculum sp. A6E488]